LVAATQAELGTGRGLLPSTPGSEEGRVRRVGSHGGCRRLFGGHRSGVVRGWPDTPMGDGGVVSIVVLRLAVACAYKKTVGEW
jgi:hypothetical protein